MTHKRIQTNYNYKSTTFSDSKKNEIANENDDSLIDQKEAEDQMAKIIFELIDHYKQTDPIGLPIPVPDPVPVPDIKKSLSLATLNLKNSSVYGVSKFRVKHLKTNIMEMKVDCGIKLDVILMIGNYTLSALFAKSAGPYTITLKDVYVNGNASIGVERDGKLRTQDIKIDITFSDLLMNFQNLGMMGSIFQSVANSASNQIFDTVKPFILTEAYTKMRTEVDAKLDEFTGEFVLPNSITPIDSVSNQFHFYIDRKFDYCNFRLWLNFVKPLETKGMLTTAKSV